MYIDIHIHILHILFLYKNNVRRFKASRLSVCRRTKNISTLKYKDMSGSGERVICILILLHVMVSLLELIIMSFEKISLWRIQLLFLHTHLRSLTHLLTHLQHGGQKPQKRSHFYWLWLGRKGNRVSTYPPKWRALWKPKCNSLSLEPRVQCLKWTDPAATQKPRFCHLQKSWYRLLGMSLTVPVPAVRWLSKVTLPAVT